MGDVIDMAEKKQTREEARTAKQDAAQQTFEAAGVWLDQNPLRFVVKLNRYLMMDSQKNWFPADKAALRNRFGILNDGTFFSAVSHHMEEQGFMFNDTTYSVRPDLPPDVFNMMNMDNWLQPDASSPHHWLFDALIQSLGANKPQNMNHIEEVLTYKHRHPEAYTLPALFISGQGGIGKNVLVQVCAKMFNGAAVALKTENMIGNFNAMMAGKVVVMLDESKEDGKEDALKAIVGNEKIIINQKNVPQYEADNTALYIISSQNNNGLWLDRSSADRRWSVLQVPKAEGKFTGKYTLNYWVAVHEGWIQPDDEGERLQEGCAQAAQWMMDTGFAILTDKQQIGYWLGSLYAKHGDKPHPLALHGEDFKRLMHNQMPASATIIEAVFNDQAFTHISMTALYKGYRWLASQGGTHPTSARNFNSQVESWLEANKPNIKRKRVSQNGQNNKLWLDTGCPKAKRLANVCNDRRYLTEEYERWIGPTCTEDDAEDM